MASRECDTCHTYFYANGPGDSGYCPNHHYNPPKKEVGRSGRGGRPAPSATEAAVAIIIIFFLLAAVL